MGKDFATNLGLNYQQVMIIGVALVSIMSATVVMIVGQLPFLGLIVPNLVSLYYGDNLRKIFRALPFSGRCSCCYVI